MSRHKCTVLLLFAVAALAALLIFPFVGMTMISMTQIWDKGADAVNYDIFWQLRVPRVLVAFLAGGVLAISGMVFQAMFRNSLATPFTLGVASGASLGASLYFQLGMTFTLLGFSGVSFFAFVGAFLTIIVVYGLTRLKKGFTITTMLLAGVSLNFFFSSLIAFMQYMGDLTHTFRVVRWMMGSLDVNGMEAFYNLAPFAVLGLVVVLYLATDLNILSTGEELALSRGVNVGRTKNILFFMVSIIVGAVVAVCGPIGFVGMMAPHICRLIIGNDHRFLTPVAFLFGGAFLVLCDTLARILIAPAELPVGIITAIIGCPFFLWLLLTNKQPY